MSTKISLSEATQVTETTGEFSMEDGLFVIRIPIETYISESKKSMILCSSHGAKDYDLDGMPVKVSVNVYASMKNWDAMNKKTKK